MGKVVKGDFAQKQKTVSPSGRDQPIPGYQLKIGVAFSDPLIWRTVRVPGSMTLTGLHQTIQACMGWSDMDSHQFLVGILFEGVFDQDHQCSHTRLSEVLQGCRTVSQAITVVLALLEMTKLCEIRIEQAAFFDSE